MSSHYKDVSNGSGTDLRIKEDVYISVGKSGKDVMIRANGRVYGFDTFEDLVMAIDSNKAAYVCVDYEREVG